MKPQAEIVEVAKALRAQLGIPVARGNVWAGTENEQPVLIVEIERAVKETLGSRIPGTFSGVRVIVRDRLTPMAQASSSLH